MFLAFYRGGKTLFDKVTRLRTNGDRTHVELVFSDGMSFSSSQWDGGTRFKKIEYDLSKWDLVRVEGVDEAAVRGWCQAQIGKKYDWRGILGFFAGKNEPGKADQWFCSEICTAALKQHGIFQCLTPSETSPEALWIAAAARDEALGPLRFATAA